MKIKKFAPILLFVFNRPAHTKAVLKSLKDNSFSKSSKLYIFSDNYKFEKDKKNVKEVRKIINKFKGFKSIQIINRKVNYGLSKSIRLGIKLILKKHDSFIVLEDDIVTSKNFIIYMNRCLQKYKKNKNIWHIGAWNYPMFKINDNKDVYFDRMMNCWGWATWKENWKKTEFNAQRFINKFSKKKIIKFNLDGVENFWSHLLLNKYKIINTWAIFWFLTISSNNGLCVRPKKSLSRNIGIDGSGINCQKPLFSFYNLQKLEKFFPKKFRITNKEDRKSIEQIKKFYQLENLFLLRYINKIYEKLFNIFNQKIENTNRQRLKEYNLEMKKIFKN
tara:strand:- start:541 stop:1539 length:999 start_codon:yes stop_codon:yes gene_type:complete